MRVITGIVTGAVVWVVIAVAGASVVLATAGSVLTAFRLASAGVLVALGIRQWAAATRISPFCHPSTSKLSRRNWLFVTLEAQTGPRHT
jgi:threonine/homoserine/homoserine lactone efflux protein